MLDIRKRTGVVFFITIVAQVILVSVQVQTKTGVRAIEAVSFGAFARVQAATSSFVRGGRDVWTNYGALRGARDENTVLKRQIAELDVRLQEQRALAGRTTKLQELLDLKQSTQLQTIAAEVIAGNPTPGVLQITIGRGRADGVMADMAVIAPRGIVGRVVGEPSAHAARVQLIIDRNAAAGALTERTRAGGLIAGVDRQPPLAMELVSNLADVKAGDLIVTSGVDGIYPKGYAVGVVETSERGGGLHRSITVRPAVDFSSLEEVLVVLVPARPALPAEDKPEAPAGAVK
ncbi:MAG: rod shape-determining protein MreC [Acidobacteria bacterium]|nr:rod shape-determining protein MreC [Acidobacteriota bacterium]